MRIPPRRPEQVENERSQKSGPDAHGGARDCVSEVMNVLANQRDGDRGCYQESREGEEET
jgi:hypothetical protein